MAGAEQQAIDERLNHEIRNALMGVLTQAEVLDRRFPDDPVVHDAVAHIKAAVGRSKSAVEDVTRDLRDISRRLSSLPARR
jgi:signal transduction histidine kinase